VAHAFNPSTQEAEAGQLGLHRETLSWKTKNKEQQKKSNFNYSPDRFCIGPSSGRLASVIHGAVALMGKAMTQLSIYIIMTVQTVGSYSKSCMFPSVYVLEGWNFKIDIWLGTHASQGYIVRPCPTKEKKIRWRWHSGIWTQSKSQTPFKNSILAVRWWCTPLIPALGRQS
jgi:hypothetical protein